MNIKGEILRPARLTLETAKFLGSASMHALDGVMTNLSGWPRGQNLAKNHVPNSIEDITKEIAERHDEPDLLVLNAARIGRVIRHAQTSTQAGEYLSTDYRSIIERSMRSAGCTEEEMANTLGSETLQLLIDQPLVIPRQ